MPESRVIGDRPWLYPSPVFSRGIGGPCSPRPPARRAAPGRGAQYRAGGCVWQPQRPPRGPVRVACHPLLPVSPLTLRRIKGSAFDGNARRHLDSYVVHGCRSRSGGACLSLKSDERWRDTIWVKSVMRGRPRRSPESRPVESLNFAAFGIAYYPMIHLGSVSNRYFPQREETING